MAVALLGLVVRWTSPTLGHFPGALIPWPAHGLAIAILIATPRSRRLVITLLMIAATLAGVSLNAITTGEPAVRVVAATALLIAQTVLVTLLYDRVTDGGSPLAGTTAYAKLLGVLLLGTLPFAVIASLALHFASPSSVPGYGTVAWWLAAVTSGSALVGGALAFLPGAPHEDDARRLLSVEFGLLFAVYVVALLAAFAEVGPLAGEVTPAMAALPFLVWSGLRFGIRGYGVISVLLIGTVVATTWIDIGPMVRFDGARIEQFRRGWIYVGSLVGPAMIFPVALAERAKAERRSRSALAQLRAIIEGTSDLIAAVDLNLVVIAANPSWISSFERLSGAVVHPGMSIAAAYASLPTDGEVSIALWRRALEGERFTSVREIGDPARIREEFEVTYSPVVDEQGEIVGASQVVRNITARRRREGEEAEARRLESVGRLAGGVAHDFNNLMTAVMGYSELLLASMPPDDERRADVGEIERAAARAGELTQQLLAFARRREVQPRVVDVGELIHGLTRLLEALVGPQIELDVRVDPGLRRVLVDPTQFEQVIMNLAVNARDAMPGGGRLLIEAGNDDRDGAAGVRLTVRDSGVGMPPEVQARMFEPFFTTKAVGEGTGLGLATVHGIVHQAGGRIDVRSVAGAGTVFHLFFPEARPDGLPGGLPATPAPA